MNDYNDFQHEDTKPPRYLDETILNHVNSDLNPSEKLIMTKLILIHGFVGLLTMIFCPQFNLSLTNSYEAFHYFHHTFGETICNIICGSIFLGTGALFASSILTLAELKRARKSAILYYPALSILSVGVFFLIGVETYLNVVGFWMLGAVLSSIAFVRVGVVFRERLSLSTNL